MFKKRFIKILVVFLVFFNAGVSFSADPVIDVGVYYYPGWKDNVLSNVSPRPWDAIKNYPERSPLIGFYDDGDVAVMDKQLSWMHKSGIGFLILDWYWSEKYKALKSHAIAAYFQAPNRDKIPLSILWANHTDFPSNADDFDGMVRFWMYYFKRPEYKKIDGKPLVFIFSVTQLESRAKTFGESSKSLLDRARKIVLDAGFPGIFFVGGAGANNPVVRAHAAGVPSGYDAFSAYNYHGPGTYRLPGGRTVSHSFQELDQGYRDQWRWMLEEAKVPYVIPMTSGWDKRPWGGSEDPLHDNSVATPGEFEAHISAAKKAIIDHQSLSLGMGVVCCWNEYGEGSFIEPTKVRRFETLERFQKVFAPSKVVQPSTDFSEE